MKLCCKDCVAWDCKSKEGELKMTKSIMENAESSRRFPYNT